MALVSVEPLFTGRSGQASFDNNRTFVRVYEVYTDNPYDDAVIAGTAPGFLPVMGDPHPENPAAIVSDRNIVQDDADPLRWLVTITYNTHLNLPDAVQPDGGTPANPADIAENPLRRPTIWKCTVQQVQEVARSGFPVDDAGNFGLLPKPITNSAGFLYDPPVMIEVSRPVITATRNLAFEPILHAMEIGDIVNSLPWRGIPARCARVVGAEAEGVFENNVAFWRLTYSFAIKWDTWDARPLDAGTMERIVQFGDGGGGVPVTTTKFQAILDPAGNPVTEPVPLDGNGRKLAANAGEVYRRYSCYRIRNFNTVLLV